MPRLAELMTSDTPPKCGICSEGCGTDVLIPGWIVDMMRGFNRNLKREGGDQLGRSEAIPCDECAAKRREREKWDASKTYWACKRELERIRETEQRPDWPTERWLRDNGHGNALDRIFSRPEKGRGDYEL